MGSLISRVTDHFDIAVVRKIRACVVLASPIRHYVWPRIVDLNEVRERRVDPTSEDCVAIETNVPPSSVAVVYGFFFPESDERDRFSFHDDKPILFDERKVVGLQLPVYVVGIGGAEILFGEARLVFVEKLEIAHPPPLTRPATATGCRKRRIAVTKAVFLMVVLWVL